jgi:hypothetical protein
MLPLSHVDLDRVDLLGWAAWLQWYCIEAGSWPFQRVADQLCCDILDPAWRVRHGAAAGLRELLREQASAAGVEAPLADSSSGWGFAGGTGELGPAAP